HPDIHSCPTRRSFDLPRDISENATHCNSDSDITTVCSPIIWTVDNQWSNTSGPALINYTEIEGNLSVGTDAPDFQSKTLTVKEKDRKSTRLNSSHVKI